MERKVGEIFNVNGTILQVYEAKESDGCNGCFFEELRPLCLPYICDAQEREDGKDVQFKKISKTMTREETKELLPIMQAFAEGKTIQLFTNGIWEDAKNPTFESGSMYRIKPEPKYRPFKSQKECWEEMHKHPDFGWLREKESGYLFNTMAVFNSIKIKEGDYDYPLVFKRFEFLDGTPFGIKEE